MVVDEPPRALGAPRLLLVGDGGEHHVAPEGEPLAGDEADDRCRHRDQVLHVEGTATPNAAVGDLAAEGRVGPPRGVGRDEVEVAGEEQWSKRPVALQAGDETGPARLRLEDYRFDAVPTERLSDPLGGRALVTRGVRGVDAEKVPEQCDRLVAHGLPVRQAPPTMPSARRSSAISSGRIAGLKVPCGPIRATRVPSKRKPAARRSRGSTADVVDIGEASRGLLRRRPVTFRYRQVSADESRPR